MSAGFCPATNLISYPIPNFPQENQIQPSLFSIIQSYWPGYGRHTFRWLSKHALMSILPPQVLEGSGLFEV